MNKLWNLADLAKARLEVELDKRRSVDGFARIVRRLARKNSLREAWSILNRALMIYPRHLDLIAMAEELPPHYDKAFYDSQVAGSLRSARAMIGLLLEHRNVNSIVDVGAGIGTWLKAGSELGVSDLTAIEGEWVRDNKDRFQRANYLYQDLNTKVVSDRKFDLAVSVEVAEHLRPERSPGFVKDLCKISDLVIFGAAMPRQAGFSHINGRPHSYWIAQFKDEGYACYDLFRPANWYNSLVEPWYIQNTFLYAAPVIRDQLSGIPLASIVNIYHPLLMNTLAMEDCKKGIIDPGMPLNAVRLGELSTT